MKELRFVEVFQNKVSGWAIGYFRDTPFQGGDVCFTKDMVTWRPFAASGFAGSSVNHTVTCRDPEAHDAVVTLTKVRDTLWWNGVCRQYEVVSRILPVRLVGRQVRTGALARWRLSAACRDRHRPPKW